MARKPIQVIDVAKCRPGGFIRVDDPSAVQIVDSSKRKYECPFVPVNESIYITEGKALTETKLESGIVMANLDRAHGLNASRMGRVVATSLNFRTEEGVELPPGTIVLYDPTCGRPRTYMNRAGKMVNLRRLGIREIEAFIHPDCEDMFASQVDGE